MSDTPIEYGFKIVTGATLADSLFNSGPILIDIDDGYLALPPHPSILFKDRPRDQYGSRISLEVFLQETWGDYCNNKLMYSEWIRRIDPSLYKAILNRTANKGTFVQWCFKHGILTKHHMHHPPKGYERHVRAIKIATAKQGTIDEL
jgi:hypothetical protein